jgi:hypothetical protein
METRVAFWLICQDAIEGFEGVRGRYIDGINSLITNSNLDMDRITKKIQIYKELMNI